MKGSLESRVCSRDYFKVKSGFSQRSKKRTASKLYSKDFSMAGTAAVNYGKAGGVGKYYASLLLWVTFLLKNLNIRV
jgi:cell division protein FtsI (penicillin-binding protein 3)